MSEQFLLPGLEPPPVPTDRLFFAVVPDAAAVERITQLTRRISREHALHGKPIDTARLHITLLFLGDHAGLPDGVVAIAKQVAAMIKQPSFTAHFDHVMSFSGNPNHRPLVLLSDEGAAGLLNLYQALLTGLRGYSHLPSTRTANFTPHVTLLYDRVSVPKVAIEPIEWQVRDFVLLHSRIGRGGSYEVLGRWPLHVDV